MAMAEHGDRLADDECASGTYRWTIVAHDELQIPSDTRQMDAAVVRLERPMGHGRS